MTNLVPEEQVERNQELINDYLAVDSQGKPLFSTAQLVGKYKISSSRIYELLRKKGVYKPQIKTTKKGRKTKKG